MNWCVSDAVDGNCIWYSAFVYCGGAVLYGNLAVQYGRPCLKLDKLFCRNWRLRLSEIKRAEVNYFKTLTR